MLIKNFFKLSSNRDQVEVRQDGVIIYQGSVGKYNSINKHIKDWYLYTESYDYPVIVIEV